MPPKTTVGGKTARKPSAPKRKAAKERGENEFWFCRRTKAFKLGKTSLRGVNPTIAATLLTPATQEDLKTLKLVPYEAPVAKVRLYDERKVSSYQKKLGGFRKGTFVHSQIEKLINKRKALAAGETGSKAAKARVDIHPQAELAFKLLDKCGVDIVASELPVWWKAARIGTRIDVDGKHRKTGRSIVSDMKTGKKNGYFRAKYRTRFKPYTLMSEFHRDCLQNFITTILRRHTFPKQQVGDALILHAPDNTEAAAYSIPLAILEMKPQITRILEATATR